MTNKICFRSSGDFTGADGAVEAVNEVKEKIISSEIEVPADKESFEAKYGDVYELD